MLRNLKVEMTRKDVSTKQLADLLGVRLSTAYDKLNGKYDFTFSEALLIKQTYFPEENIEELFESEEQTQEGKGVG